LLTGRDEAGKSVIKSFDVTSEVVAIVANPGLTFYELYATLPPTRAVVYERTATGRADSSHERIGGVNGGGG
jgi:predicted transcriptional regulator